MPDDEQDGATRTGDGGLPAGSGVDLVILEQRSLARRPLVHHRPLSIGRGDGCDVVLKDPAASRRHALLHVARDLSIEDLGSRNGTRLRGARLPPRERTALRLGDAVHIGSAILLVQPGGRGERYDGPARSVGAPAGPGAVVSSDPEMRAVDEMVERVAPTHVIVLVTGETGVGKEVVAERIHRLSGARSAQPFMQINCAALNGALLESELFGHERGAFTGAYREKVGLFEAADGGTAFLDEIGELPLSAQAKLLRVLETREVLRVGGVKPRRVDVRFVAATNRDLRAEVARGAFREDLYFRLSGATIRVPPLRRRPSDIEPLMAHFVGAFCRQLQREPPVFSRAAAARLRAYAWPGNIRELRNVVECAVLCATGPTIEIDQLPPDWSEPTIGAAAVSPRPPGLDTVPPAPRGSESTHADVGPLDAPESERDRIVAALAACHGNQTRAAERLQMPRRTFVRKLSLYGIPRPNTAPRS